MAPSLLAQQVLAVYCVVPLLFGLDLLWSAMTRGRLRVIARRTG